MENTEHNIKQHDQLTNKFINKNVVAKLYTAEQEWGGCLTFRHVMLGKGSPSASQGITSSLPASCLYSPPGTTENLGGSCPVWNIQTGG